MTVNLRQLLAVFIVAQPLLIIGMSITMSSVIIIQAPVEANRLLNPVQLSWTISITYIGSLAGTLLGAALAPTLGVRRLLVLTCPLSVIGAVTIALGDHFVWILLGTAVISASMGASNASARGYVSEIASPSNRAPFSVLMNISMYVGMIISLFLGSILHWQYVFLLSSVVPCAVCGIGILFLPSSPKWLLARGRPEQEAREALKFYQLADSDIDDQIQSIQESLKHISSDHDTVSTWRLILRRETLHPLFLVCMQTVFYCWCGGTALVVVTAYIFETLHLPLSRYYSSMLPSVVSIISSLCGSVLLKRFNRLTMLRLAGVISAVGCVVISTCFFLSINRQKDLAWIVLVGSVLCQWAHASVISPLTYNYCNELLPNRTRAIGANIGLSVMDINVVILMKSKPLMQASIGIGGAFLIYAVFSLLQIVFATAYLPETAGLSLEQVQKLFQATERTTELVWPTLDPPDSSDKSRHLDREGRDNESFQTTHM